MAARNHMRLPNPKWREVFGFRGRYCENVQLAHYCKTMRLFLEWSFMTDHFSIAALIPASSTRNLADLVDSIVEGCHLRPSDLASHGPQLAGNQMHHTAQML